MDVAAAEWRKARVDAISVTAGILFNGCLCSIMGSIFSPPTIAVPISVGVRVGATTFTLTFGAKSAAKAIAKPSKADLAAEIAQ